MLSIFVVVPESGRRHVPHSQKISLSGRCLKQELMVEDLATVSRCLLKLDLPVCLAAAAAIANHLLNAIFGANRGVESLSSKVVSSF